MLESLLMHKKIEIPIETLGEDDYLGLINSSDFLTGGQISALTGVTQGNLVRDNDLKWLMFRIDNKILYIAQGNVRNSVSWSTLNVLGAVYGSKTITVNGHSYKVRLCRGDIRDPSLYNDASRLDLSLDNSEWARTIAQVARTSIGGTGKWATMSSAELNIHTGDNGASWMQETYSRNTSNRLIRGSDMTMFYFRPATESSTYRNWRPVLELIS